MATGLASQLARIRAQSTNPLDLKSQKKAHSHSLLFDTRVAATQDFDSVYQLCFEGFEELCRLDSRFIGFARNVFSEQSKQEDRTQMTATQNQQLDVVLEDFLTLIGGRLLLKPAQKALEWLIRRFRVHENNTLCLAMTFLPYHTSPIFQNMLSILPQKIPLTLKFLHPYIQSLANPPRHTVVYAVSNSRDLLSAFNAYVLRCCRLGHHYPAMIAFWASTTTEATAAMLDQARSARQEAQRQNQEDVVFVLLPVLNEGLSMTGLPDLRVGCYMILTVLASKAKLEDDALDLMMEAVTTDWNESSHAGLICLAVLSQRKHNNNISRKVLKAVLSIENLDDDLMILKTQYKVDKLTLGIVLGVISRLKKARDASELRVVRALLEADLMESSSVAIAIESVLSSALSIAIETNQNFDVEGCLADLLLRLAGSKVIGSQVQDVIKESELDLDRLKPRLHRLIRASESTPGTSLADTELKDADEPTVTEDFKALTSRIPTKTAYEISFLSHSDSYVFGSLAQAFYSGCGSSANLELFSNLPVLRKSLAMREPLYLSFFVRIWCGNGPASARVAAIRTTTDYFRNEALTTDVQVLLPYIIYGLADPSIQVRRATVDLVLTLSSARAHTPNTEKELSDLAVLGRDQIYGQGPESKQVLWLSHKDSALLMEDLLIPGLEECLVDGHHVSQLLSDNLNGSKHGKGSTNTTKELKTTLRLSFFSCLCSHVVNSPLYTVKFRLLQTLNLIEKVGSISRTKLLLPFLSHLMDLNHAKYVNICQREHVDPPELLELAVTIVTSTDREGIQTLKAIIDAPDHSNLQYLRAAALRRIRAIWPSMKADLQLSLAERFLMLAAGNFATANEAQGADVMETLRLLPLSTHVLQSFLAGLKTVSCSVEEKGPATKRRRTSHGQTPQKLGLDDGNMSLALRKITLVLELVEGSRVEHHPMLVKDLFQVVTDLQHSQIHSGTSNSYLQILALDSILSIVRDSDTSPSTSINPSAIRADVLIDCIRTTTSPQVRNTALLLVSALAKVIPELILHSVMPIFTFMGANVLRQEDDFSTYVVKQTMESVIPCLVKSLHKRKRDPFVGISELLLSFAAAFEHVPSQRRISLFSSLIDKVGPDQYLFALLAILLDKHPNNRRALQFSVELTAQYTIAIQLKTIHKYLDVILDAWGPKPTVTSSLLLSVKSHMAESVTANLLPLMTSVLNSESIISKAAKALKQEGEDAATVRSSYTQILEKLFLLSQKTKTNKRLDNFCIQVLDATLNLLPMWELVSSLETLLATAEDSLRRQVLQSFERRLNDRKSDQQASQRACLAFVPQLVSILRESSDLPLKHIVVASLDRIVEKFGKGNPGIVLEAAWAVSSDKCLQAVEISFRTTSLLCLATMIEVSEEALVPVIPLAFAMSMENLSTSISVDTEDASLHNAAYSFVVALLLYVPWMITGSDLDKILTMSHESANAEMGEECDETRTEALKIIPKQIEAKDCFAVLDRTWTSAMSEGPIAIKEHLEILRLAIERQPKSIIAKQSETLGGLFIKAFDLRRIQLCPRTDDSYSDEEIEEVETAINECAIVMTYRLNDTTFRPLFRRIMEWATGVSSKKDSKNTIYRQTAWFTFLLKFFDTLKSIVTSYTAFILEDAVEIIKSLVPEDEDSITLWRRVIQTLHKTFEHDQDDFYQSPAHFTPVCSMLIAQLVRAAHIPMTNEVIPAIAELAVATDSSTHHKEMNTTILQYMRSDDAAVRLAAVKCEQALTDSLGEEWLALLPEMLPFISELQEDEDEAVERETLRWIQRIEEILGESLIPMLQ